ncbi:MAG: hypothetical protein HKN32_08320, partial [Flavobacteriales bacterium]|nr:hypothetical protein [Flavobacteriales bacterium]
GWATALTVSGLPMDTASEEGFRLSGTITVQQRHSSLRIYDSELEKFGTIRLKLNAWSFAIGGEYRKWMIPGQLMVSGALRLGLGGEISSRSYIEVDNEPDIPNPVLSDIGLLLPLQAEVKLSRCWEKWRVYLGWRYEHMIVPMDITSGGSGVSMSGHQFVLGASHPLPF